MIAILFWVRGPELGLRRRLALARARLHGPTARTAGVAIALILALGGFIFYNTNILNEYRGRDEAGLPQAEYERRYGRFEDAPQPVIIDADLRVEIYPDEPAVDMRGSYRLVNRTGAAIDSVHVVIDRDVDARSMSFDRAAKPVVVDDELGYRIFALERALEPGDSLRLSFDVAFRPRGFREQRHPDRRRQQRHAISTAGWLPFVGYQPVFEVSDDAARKRFGLAPRPPMPAADDAEARRVRRDRAERGCRSASSMIVGTAADQIAVTPGVLRRSWTENGRRYFHYETDVPATFGASVFSAKYAVRRGPLARCRHCRSSITRDHRAQRWTG